MERDYKREQKLIRAQKRVKDIKGFYTHLFITILIIPFLVFINLKFVPQFHWFWYAAIGMSLGVFFHWLGVFGFKNVLGKDWEEKKIKEIMDEENKRYK
ncbi:2TM domain-containing protein [Pseudotenacibaculum haliotis]|uniref:2TM domain-containing protein n=1 Tax=Pseudotenacibaculum haliotis TaxID=1862138 RepID=A0ABW5LT62_9FLAO